MYAVSKAHMNPDAIELENKFHAKMKGAYSLVLKDARLSDDVRMALEEGMNYHEECQENKPGPGQEAENIKLNCGKINCSK